MDEVLKMGIKGEGRLNGRRRAVERLGDNLQARSTTDKSKRNDREC